MLEGMHKRSSTMATSGGSSRELRGTAGRTVVVATSDLDVMGGRGTRPRPRPVTCSMGTSYTYSTSIPATTATAIPKVLNTEPILLCSRSIQIQRVLFTLCQFPQYRFYFRPPRFGRMTLIAGHGVVCFLSFFCAILRQRGQLQLPLPLCKSPTLIYRCFASLRDC